MDNVNDSNWNNELAVCVSKWYYKVGQCMLGLMQNPRRIVPVRLPFRLFCVCTVILSVSSTFQRPVLGMHMRKKDNELWILIINSLCLLLLLFLSVFCSIVNLVLHIKLIMKTSFEKKNLINKILPNRTYTLFFSMMCLAHRHFSRVDLCWLNNTHKLQ